MNFLSLNIRYGLAEDGPFSWPYRKDKLCRLLFESDADFICLQEVFDFQLSEICAALPGYGYVGVGRDDGAYAGEFAPIFYRGEPPSFQETFWLSDQPVVPGSIGWGASLPRICTWARFGSLRVANLHLDHESKLARKKGIELVLNRTQADIVCGDFNATPEEETIQLVLAAGYTDLGPAQGTFNDFNEDPENPPKIDYIFGATGFRGEVDLVTTPLVSDHWALLARIT